MIGPVKAVLGLGASSILLAQIPPVVSGGAIDSAGRLSLDAALVIAVGVLWRTIGAKDARIAEKDSQIIAMATKVTETMALVMEAVKELRTTVTGLRLSFDDLPCAVREKEAPTPRHRS